MRSCCRQSCDDRQKVCHAAAHHRFSTLNSVTPLSIFTHKTHCQRAIIPTTECQNTTRWCDSVNYSLWKEYHTGEINALGLTEMMFIISITSCANRPKRKHYNYEQTYLHCVTLQSYSNGIQALASELLHWPFVCKQIHQSPSSSSAGMWEPTRRKKQLLLLLYRDDSNM